MTKYITCIKKVIDVLRLTGSPLKSFVRLFSIDKFQRALKQLKQSKAGIDIISSELPKHLSIDALHVLIEILNCSVQHAELVYPFMASRRHNGIHKKAKDYQMAWAICQLQ